ncbi:MAG: T9SS type A sorting domain-containing protein [Bacteroidia bacterium]
MIKKILSVLFLFAGVISYAQQLTNSGFETWSGSPSAPSPWGTLDQGMTNAGLTGSSYVTKSTSPNTGSFAATIKTQAAPIVGTITSGAMIYGTITVVISTGKAVFRGLPYTGMPTSTSYYIKGTLNAADTCGIFIMLSHWNTGTGKRDTLGKGIDTVTSLTASYVMRTVPVKYTISGTPDSIQYIIASSAKKTPAVGTVITVDDVNLNFATGIQPLAFGQSENNAYPNPARDQITLSGLNEKAKFIAVYDITGRTLCTKEVTGKTHTLDLENFRNGMYIYSILDEQNRVIKSSRFIVSR